MDEMGWLMVWGTTLLFIDAILIVLLYERTAKWLGERQTLRILVSSMVVLTFDQLGFLPRSSSSLVYPSRSSGAAGSPRWVRRWSTAA